MSTGVIGYAVNGGGISEMIRALRKHLGIRKQLAIPHDGFDPPFDMKWAEDCFLSGCPQDGHPFDLKAYQWAIQRDQLKAWVELEQISTVVTVESPFGHDTFRWCHELGVKVVLIVMSEFVDYDSEAYRNVDLYICPTWLAFQECPFDNKVYLKWPIDTTALAFRQRTGPARTFLHTAGGGGMAGRKGTFETLVAFKKAYAIRQDIRLIVRAQKPLAEIVPNFYELSDGWLTVAGPTDTVPELYAEGDVLLYPSHWDGDALVPREAMACGMAVAVTDVAPINEILPPNDPLLIPVKDRCPAPVLNKLTQASIVDTGEMAARIVWAASNDLAMCSRLNRTIIEVDYSWEVLGARWREILEMVNGK